MGEPQSGRAHEGRPPAGAVPSLGYVPALDGLRAVAVCGVLAYHGGMSWLPGGFLGVDAFFVLSGFLITSLLLEEWGRTGSIRLGAFWARRARRLLPALVVVVLFVVCYAAYVAPAGAYPGLRGDALSALFYFANWHFVAAGSNYFSQTGLASPLTHTWSLAIEEQFYLVWPVALLVLLRRIRPRPPYGTVLGVCLALACASAIEMAVLYGEGTGTTRLYYGTDTHAQSLLAGAALAAALAMVGARRRGPSTGRSPRSPAAGGWALPSRRGTIVCAAAGWAGIAGGAAMWASLDGTDALLYRGGFALAALATAGVLVSVVCVPRGVLARALSLAPVRYVGRISYGVYLWHVPLFIWIDGARTGLAGYPLFAVRVATTLAVATASYYLIERPVRRGAFLGHRHVRVALPAALGATVAALLVATAPGTVVAQAPAAERPVQGVRDPVRVLVVGDSTALTLGIALSTDAREYGVTLRDEAILGCGVAEGREVETTGDVVAVAAPCSSAPPRPGTPMLETTMSPFGTTVTSPDAEKWTAWYAHWVAAFRPRVVVLLAGRWEVMTRTYHDRWTNILQPAFAAYVERQLERAVGILSARGARVALLTAPCYDHGEQPDGKPWPTDSAARVGAYDRIVGAVGEKDRSTVSVVRLGALVCPGGVYHRVLGGVVVRSADGVHFTWVGGRYLGPRLWPEILRAAGPAARATPGGPGQPGGQNPEKTRRSLSTVGS